MNNLPRVLLSSRHLFIYLVIYLFIYLQIRLCKLSIYHFQQYVHLTPGDPDNAKINEAVSILQQRLDTFNKLNKVTICSNKTNNNTDDDDDDDVIIWHLYTHLYTQGSVATDWR